MHGKTDNKRKCILLKNLKYKCINGKVKSIDLNNDNLIILSKHKKNYDFNNFAEKFITSSVPDLNSYRKSKNNLKNANNNIKEKQLLSNYNINRDKNNNKSANKKSSVYKNNEINKKYQKKISVKNNSGCDLINKNINNNKDKYIYKNTNNYSHRITADQNFNNRKNKKNINKLNKDIDNKNGKFNEDADKVISSKKEKKSGSSCKKNKFI